MTSHKRIVLIGMDAADQELLREGIEQGRLPTLASMQARGAWGVVDGLPGLGSGAVWPSFYTGVSPASHGRYFYRQVRPGEYEAHRFGDHDFKARAIWDYASAAGRRVAVFDVPKATLSPDVNGLHVVDWIVHGPVYRTLTTAPASLAEEIESKYGLDPLPQCDRPGGRTPDEHAELRDVMVARVETRERATLDYLAREDWDLFVTVFGEPHCVGHQSWHVRDPRHPDYDPAAFERASDPLMDVYAAIDAATGRILEAVGDDALVLVVSVTGMGANYTGNFILDEALRRLEGQRKTLGYTWAGRAKQLAKKVLPRDLRRRFRRRARAVEERFAHPDRARRTCFAVPHNDISGAIRVNLIGREPNGTVRPEELPQIHERLRRELMALRNLDTGGPVVKDVVRVADLWRGDSIDELPDFFVLWHRDQPIERVASDTVGTITHRHRGNRTGDHRPESIFFAQGEGVRPGRVDDVSVLDFAATMADLLELDEMPREGRPIEALGAPVEPRPAAAGGGAGA
jgi:predicted AlkP superfamily phosphohydrolase/phosphomutase